MPVSQAQARARLKNSQVRRTFATSKTRRIVMNLLHREIEANVAPLVRSSQPFYGEGNGNGEHERKRDAR